MLCLQFDIMEDDDYILSICALILATAYHLNSRRKRKRTWVRPWLGRRKVHGAYHALTQELAEEDPQSFLNFARMDKNDFDDLLKMVSPLIKRRNTCMREAISAAERLSLTLRYLATGKMRTNFKIFISCRFQLKQDRYCSTITI